MAERLHHLHPQNVNKDGLIPVEVPALARAGNVSEFTSPADFTDFRPAGTRTVYLPAGVDLPDLRFFDSALERVGGDKWLARVAIWHTSLADGTSRPWNEYNHIRSDAHPEARDNAVTPPPAVHGKGFIGKSWQFFDLDGNWKGGRVPEPGLDAPRNEVARTYAVAVNPGHLPLDWIIWANVLVHARALHRMDVRRLEGEQVRAASQARYLDGFRVREGQWQHGVVRWLAAVTGGPQAVAKVDEAAAAGLSAQQILDGARR